MGGERGKGRRRERKGREQKMGERKGKDHSGTLSRDYEVGVANVFHLQNVKKFKKSVSSEILQLL